MGIHQAALCITECAMDKLDEAVSRRPLQAYHTCRYQCSTKDIPGKADGKLQGYRCPGSGIFRREHPRSNEQTGHSNTNFGSSTQAL